MRGTAHTKNFIKGVFLRNLPCHTTNELLFHESWIGLEQSHYPVDSSLSFCHRVSPWMQHDNDATSHCIKLGLLYWKKEENVQQCLQFCSLIIPLNWTHYILHDIGTHVPSLSSRSNLELFVSQILSPNASSNENSKLLVPKKNIFLKVFQY